MRFPAFLRKPINLFYLISLVGIAGFFICACLAQQGTTLFDWLVMGGNSDYALTDYSRHVGYAIELERVYHGSRDACFPPLTYLFFHFLCAINPVSTQRGLWYKKIFRIKYEPLIYIMWTLLQSTLLFYLIKKITKLSLNRALCLTLLLFFSLPFFGGAFERGNPVLVTTIFLCAALYLREQPERWKQELALILIACAAAFKVIPCVMGLLYIKERKWKDAAHLMIYVVLLFFLPFIFTGGFDGLKRFMVFIAEESRIKVDWWTSFPGFVRYWTIRAFGHESDLVDAAVKVLFPAVMIMSAFLTRKKWKTILYLSMIMAYGHAKTYRYYTVYLILPLLYLITETNGRERLEVDDYIYFALFAGIFTIPIWGIVGNPEYWMCSTAYLLCLRALVTDAQDLLAGRYTAATITTP